MGKIRAPEGLGWSWVQIPSGARIFPTSQWVPSAIDFIHIYHSHICSFGEKRENRKKALNAKMLPSKNYEQGKNLNQICYIFVLL